MDSPQMEVKCSVTNCKYNKQNHCYAKNLAVNAIGDGYAKTSDGTACTTFESKTENNRTF